MLDNAASLHTLQISYVFVSKFVEASSITDWCHSAVELTSAFFSRVLHKIVGLSEDQLENRREIEYTDSLIGNAKKLERKKLFIT